MSDGHNGHARRVLPHNDDAEASILGAIILRNEILHVLPYLEVDDFYDHRHKVVFQAMRNLATARTPIDQVTLANEIAMAGKLDAIGGIAFLGELVLRLPTGANVRLYDRMVRRKHQARKLMLAASEVAEQGYDEDLDVDDYLERGPAKIAAVVQRISDGSPWQLALTRALVDIRGTLGQCTVERRPIFEGSDAVDLLQQEFPATTWLVHGLVTRGGITMLAGEPKTLKTWTAAELAIAVAMGSKAFGEFYAEHGRAAYIFAEDTPRQVRNRLRALLAGRADGRIGRGSLHLRGRGTFLDITKDEDLAWILASARELGQLDLLVLDPLRDISSAAEDKSDDMSPVMRRLRLLAELLNCTIAVVHHAGKYTADTAKRRPGQRMRGSSAIHGSADSGIYFGDTAGDGTTTFANTVDSEVKGARSAGRFKLELAIEDDAGGEAVRASWTYSRDAGPPTGAKPDQRADKHAADDTAAWDFVRDLAIQGKQLTRTALREHDQRPLAQKRLMDAIDRLLEARRLRLLQSGEIALPEARSC